MAEEVVVDLDAAAAEAAKKAANKGKNEKEAASKEPEVVVEPEVAASAKDKEGPTPDEALDKLKKDLAAEREGRLAAEARANESARAEAEAKNRAQTSDLDLVKSAIERVTAERANL